MSGGEELRVETVLIVACFSFEVGRVTRALKIPREEVAGGGAGGEGEREG